MAGFIKSRLCAGVWLIVANVVLYLAYLTAYWCGHAEQWQAVLSLPSDFDALMQRVWTPISYMFVQYNFTHLLFNMLWLWAGVLIARRLGGQRWILPVYIAGGLCGALFFLITSAVTGGAHMLVGSSASVIALMAYCTAKAPDYKISLYGFSVRLIWVGVFLTLLLFLGNTGVCALMAHLGGLLAGVMAGLIKKRVPHEHPVDPSRLDALLDKVRLSGYESLSAKEKDELQRISKKL